MKRQFISAVLSGAAGCLPFVALADTPVRVGILLGFTGPVESIVDEMAASAELALAEASSTGLFLGGRTIEPIRGDSTCTDASVATATAERLIESEGVSGIVGAACSGATSAVVANVAAPRGVVAISPSSTSPGLTGASPGLFFRTAPSDARQGEIMAQVAIARGLEEVALTYTNNDYGRGLAEVFERNFVAAGGTVTVSLAHEDGKGDYSAEIGALASAGGDALVVIGYVDQGGQGILQTSLDTGAFDRFVFSEGMMAQSLIDRFGDDIEGSFGTRPGSEGAEAQAFSRLLTQAGIVDDGPYKGESYDAAALLILAMQAAGSTASADYAGRILEVANTPGTPIGPGEIGRALEILAAGGDVDYVGATSVELDADGDTAGTYSELEITENGFEPIALW